MAVLERLIQRKSFLVKHSFIFSNAALLIINTLSIILFANLEASIAAPPGTPATASPVPPAAHSYKSYVNVRYRYSIEYPAELLFAQGESENGDGQRFVSHDNQAQLTSWGEHAVNTSTGDPQSLTQLYATETEKNRKDITYKTIAGNWYVTSGITGSNIFYRKTLLEGGDFKRFELTYPTGQRKLFDPVVAHISKSFRSTVSSAQSTKNRFGLPGNALILETGNLPASECADRTLVLWMLNAEKHPYSSGEVYSCVDATRGNYYSGLLRVSLVNTKTDQLINTVTVDSPPGSEGKTIDIPYSIRGGENCFYRVPGASGNKEGKPKIINLVDLNGDGKALEFVLYNAENCNLLDTALFGYSARQDKVIQYPVKLSIRDPKEKPVTELRKWVIHLFSSKPKKPGYFKYEVDLRGTLGPLDKFEVKYDAAHELFTGTLQRIW